MVIIDTLIHTLLGGLTLHHAGMHCPSWDDAFVSSYCSFLLLLMQNIFLCNISLSFQRCYYVETITQVIKLCSAASSAIILSFHEPHRP